MEHYTDDLFWYHPGVAVDVEFPPWTFACPTALEKTVPDARNRLLALYGLFPFEAHPLWHAIFAGDLSQEAVLKAEVQHYLRTRAGGSLRFDALKQGRSLSPRVFEKLFETYLEECTTQRGPQSHLELVEQLLLLGGLRCEEFEGARTTVGNALAIARYKEISAREAACHLLGAGAVEFHYSRLSPKIFHTYTGCYGMSEEQAATYAIHGHMDKGHAERAFSALEEAIELRG